MVSSATRAVRSARTFCGRERPAGVPVRASSSADGRWNAIEQALADLRTSGRYSVRIVDADCGSGKLLMQAAHYARALGFTAIEARGIDGAPSLIARARAAAGRLHDPAIGLSFEVADLITALREEAEFPGDILLWNGHPAAFEQRPVLDALRRAATCLIIDNCRALPARGERRS